MTDRISSAFATWDHFVAECARAGLTVDPHAMTQVLLTTRTVGMPTRWEVTVYDFASWWATGERGLSSEALAHFLERGQVISTDHPHDPSDFRRCVRMLEATGTAGRIHEAAAISPVWRRLVRRWQEISDLMEVESPGCLGPRPDYRGTAPKAYAAIRECCEVES